MLMFGLKTLPRISYNQLMYDAFLTLLLGLMLSLSGGASALTFGKDGKQINQTIPDHQTPKELLAPVDAENKLINLAPGDLALNHDYSQEWNLCALISHNIFLLLDKCNPGGETRRPLALAIKNRVLSRCSCSHMMAGQDY